METIKKLKQLKEQIHQLEIEKESCEKFLKSYFSSTSNNITPGSVLKNIVSNAKAPTDLKSIIVKNFVGIVTDFLVKKIFSKKAATPTPETSDLIVNDVIDKAVERNSNDLTKEERKIFKKMLRQYLASE